MPRDTIELIAASAKLKSVYDLSPTTGVRGEPFIVPSRRLSRALVLNLRNDLDRSRSCRHSLVDYR